MLPTADSEATVPVVDDGVCVVELGTLARVPVSVTVVPGPMDTR